MKNMVGRCGCPMCEQQVVGVENCGFFNAGYKFYGVDNEGERREGEGEGNRENYTTFEDDEDEEWVVLRIQVLPLKFEMF